ncbi:hypothetical protein G6F65_020796 [Rhizopus arrhizus]|nr:hypothetical protein G6F65_020796 [Rhizopus arrhizus]
MRIENTGCRRRAIEHEGEFAALGQQRGAGHGFGVGGAQQPRHHVHAHGLDQHEHQHGRQDQRPFPGYGGQVERHAHAQEEQAEQDPAKGLDLGLQLVAERGLRQQDAGQEGAHRHRQAAQFHQ